MSHDTPRTPRPRADESATANGEATPAAPDTLAPASPEPRSTPAPAPDPQSDTAAWYDENARQFFDQTVELPLAHAYEAFLPRLPRGGRILDAGCGSGRDTRRFLEMGYQVEAFDASARMVRLASKHTGLAVRRLRFDELDAEGEYDGVFANACLLHVSPAELPAVLARLAAALKPGGVLFASLKRGDGETMKDGILYVRRHTETGLRRDAESTGLLSVERLWTTPDNRPGRGDERWLHLLAARIQNSK